MGRLLAAGILATSALFPTIAAGAPDEGLAGPRGATVTVAARDDFFRPGTVTISRGSSVRWVNRGENIHTTTGSTWDVTLSPGERFTKRFRRAGTFRYSCILHSGMTGRIIVE